MLEKNILNKANSISQNLVKIRRDIHLHPEIGFEEIRTADLIADRLEKLGIQVQKGVGKTGVIGLLKGKCEGKTIMLRADMDCLKIVEKNEIDYKSENMGLMHACGHDVHVAWLLGAAEILAEMKDELQGNVKFVFQPAEESAKGAKLMIKEGVLDNPKVDAVIGAHVWPYLETGKVGIKKGILMAATDNFKLTIYGKGGHGAHPHKCKDPIASASEIYMGLQTIVSRSISPLDPAVISIGKFYSGIAYNVIPDTAFLEGTARTLSSETRNRIPELMENIIRGITESNGTKYKFEYTQYHPCINNDNSLTDLIQKSAEELMGNNVIEHIETPTMAGEDFSYYQEEVPGSFFWVGTGNEKLGTDLPLHSSNFMVDESVIHETAALMAKCAIDFLK